MARRKSKKYTANQREYAKQVKRIKSFISRAEKRGYRFESNILPETPQRITKKTLQTLKELTPDSLYKKATTIDYETGEIISGTLGRKLERQERARKSAETRKNKKNKNKNKNTRKDNYYPQGGEIIYFNVYEQFISRLSEPTPEFYTTLRGRTARRLEQAREESERQKHTLLSITYSVIESEGVNGLAKRMEQEADRVNVLVHIVLYDSKAEHIASASAELASIIKGGALSMQELKDIAVQEEYNEGHELPQ